MRAATRRNVALFAVALLVASTESLATTVLRMNLEDLCRGAGRIFRGTVLEVEEGTIAVGGGILPTRTFQVRVDEGLKGDFATEKEVPVVEFRTIGKTQPRRSGRVQWLRTLPEPPALAAGSTYLLFVTAPGALGLSTTVGLGQGCFHVTGDAEREEAVNELDNVGLASPTRLVDVAPRGPIPYARLAEEVRAIVAGS